MSRTCFFGIIEPPNLVIEGESWVGQGLALLDIGMEFL